MNFENGNSQDNSVSTLDKPGLSNETLIPGYGLDSVANEFTPESQLGSVQSENLELESAGLAQFGRDDASQLVFIDSGVEDSQTLIDNISQNDISGITEVIVLNDSSDELLQISQHLDDYQGLDAVHIVSHGESGELSFENAELNQETLPKYTELIEGWGDALNPEADMLLYGCDVASGKDGDFFLKELSQITEADILASTDDTGIDGDWELETEIGEIETDDAFDDDIDDDYQDNLARKEDIRELEEDDLEDAAEELDFDDDVGEEAKEAFEDENPFTPEQGAVVVQALRNQGKEVRLELMGGEKGFLNGSSINIDTEASRRGNIQGDMDEAIKAIPDGSIKQISSFNPFPNEDSFQDFIDQELVDKLETGGTLAISGTQANQFALASNKRVNRQREYFEQIGLEVEQKNQPFNEVYGGTNPRYTFKRTTGGQIPRARLRTTILRKI